MWCWILCCNYILYYNTFGSSKWHWNTVPNYDSITSSSVYMDVYKHTCPGLYDSSTIHVLQVISSFLLLILYYFVFIVHVIIFFLQFWCHTNIPHQKKVELLSVKNFFHFHLYSLAFILFLFFEKRKKPEMNFITGYQMVEVKLFFFLILVLLPFTYIIMVVGS